MGTSSAQRSPSTPEWEQVRELYKQPHPRPGEVVGRIVQALSPAAREQMHHGGVVASLDALLWGSVSVAQQGLASFLEDFAIAPGLPVVSLAAGLRDTAQQYVARARLGSRFGELALDALGNTVMEAAAGEGGLLTVTAAEAEANYGRFAQQRRLADLSTSFLGHDFDQLFRYFVARDVSDFIGTEAFPTVSSSARFLDEVAQHCRGTARHVDLGVFEDQLHQILALPIDERIGQLQPIMAQGLATGLEVLARGA